LRINTPALKIARRGGKEEGAWEKNPLRKTISPPLRSAGKKLENARISAKQQQMQEEGKKMITQKDYRSLCKSAHHCRLQEEMTRGPEDRSAQRGDHREEGQLE